MQSVSSPATVVFRATMRHSTERTIKIILNIILERNPNQQTLYSTNRKLFVPGEIASYLCQKSYVRFLRTNRKLFVDCNSPNRLHKLDLNKMDDGFNISSVTNHRNIRQLNLRLQQVITWSFQVIGPISSYYHKLKTLCLSLDAETPLLRTFLQQNKSGFGNITTLAITGKTGTLIQWNAFVQLLSLFPNVNKLLLKNVRCKTSVIGIQLHNLSLNIKQLYLRGIRDEAIFLRSLHSTLTTLTWSPRSVQIVPAEIANLERLCLLAPPQQIMEQFLEKAKGLKQICFVPNIKKKRKQPMTDTQIERITTKLLTDYSSLEFIYLSTRGHLERMFSSLHEGLFQTRNVERNYLEIALHLDCSEIDDLTHFVSNIYKIALFLSGSQTQEWMLTLVRHKRYNWRPMTKALDHFVNSYTDLDIKLLHHSWSTLIIGNSECKALPHHHWWNDCHRTDFY